jgi:hypothetical protein
MVNSDDVDACRRLMEHGAGVDDLLRLLRDRGLGKGPSIPVMARLPGMDLKRAKELVHLSPVWADRRAADHAFHDQLERAMDELQRKNQQSTESP